MQLDPSAAELVVLHRLDSFAEPSFPFLQLTLFGLLNLKVMLPSKSTSVSSDEGYWSSWAERWDQASLDA